jgi:hypothetical protein
VGRRGGRGQTIAFGLLLSAAVLGSAREASADPAKIPPELAWNYGDVETARSTALGGAVRAIGPATTALYSNPANLAATQVYHLEGLAQIWPEGRRQSYGAAAADSVTSRLAGAIGGNYTVQDPDGFKRKAIDARLGLAFPLSDKLFIGAAGKLLRLQQDGLGPFGSSLPSGGLHDELIVNAVTFDAGLSLRPTQSFAISVVGQNLTNPGTGLQPTTVGGGLAFANTDLTIEGDIVNDFTTYGKSQIRGMAGGEYLVSNHFPVRLGYRYDQGQGTQWVSGGLGYLDQAFAVEASVRRSVDGPGATAIVVGVQYFLESTGMVRRPVEYAE